MSCKSDKAKEIKREARTVLPSKAPKVIESKKNKPEKHKNNKFN